MFQVQQRGQGKRTLNAGNVPHPRTIPRIMAAAAADMVDLDAPTAVVVADVVVEVVDVVVEAAVVEVVVEE